MPATDARVGIDFGMTIADCQTGNRDPFEGAFTIIKNIIGRFGAANCFIVSKAKAETSCKILQWLENADFYAQVGFLRESVFFVRDYCDKRILVDRFRLNFFIDDSIKVVKHIVDAPTIHRVVWFQGRHEGMKFIPKKQRFKVTISKSWNKLYKVFSSERLLD